MKDNRNDSVRGSLKVAEEVVVKVAELAALEVKGVVALKEDKCFFGNISKKNAILIRKMDDVIEVNIRVVVKAGLKTVAIAEQVQKIVKEEIQDMTGIPVARVNVSIAGISFD